MTENIASHSRRIRQLCLVLFCMCLWIAEGAGALQAKEPRQDAKSIREDSELAEKIRRALTTNQSLRGRIITVIVNDGIALLSGTVNSEAERAEAALTAFRVQGVIDVVDRITVSPTCREVKPDQR
ncbi:BON domain-containing protein [Pelotalea chapellei]|uniref:BON domain-containing protein n=1 Tax=Pelotalea chapellei TaxID=44671 RepID=A0ABS5U3T9_9BACT|nr:BON domain-containing protein [Pelotalea chapellei]MBT1070337.1 BON domain-containing protein [Pelotalea chapellei]